MKQHDDSENLAKESNSNSSSARRLLFGKDWRLGWTLLLLIHAAGCLVWWFLMPGGFPLSHLRCWANLILPWCGCLLLLSGVWAAWRGNTAWFLAIALGVTLAWSTALLVALYLFPFSSRKFLLPALAIAVLLWIAWGAAQLGKPKAWLINGFIAALVILGSGLFIYAQRGPQADTHPLNIAFPQLPENVEPISGSSVAVLSDKSSLYLTDGTLRTKCGSLSLSLSPLLTFESRSPDRCWTSLAPRKLRGSQSLVPQTVWQQEKTWGMLFTGNEKLALIVSEPNDKSTVLSAVAYAQLETPVYSHLNSFLQLDVAGHQKLGISFSPCPAAIIEVLPADYPVGRPARMAYLNAAGMFQIVEATSGEKGPFRLLAEGALDRIKPLTITFHDQGQPVCDLVLDDWATQLSTHLSPTAGWGVPAGAIEFQLLNDADTSRAGVWITLAATSVGRGWDSVGHQAGTYRNRFRVLDRRESAQ